MDYEINFHFLVSKEMGVTLDSLAWSLGLQSHVLGTMCL